jgi:hypothetical protein
MKKEFVPGGVVTAPSTWSTSKSESTAKFFATRAHVAPCSIVLHIGASSGIDLSSFNKAEKEVLLGKGSKYRVVKTTEPGENRLNVWLEEL